MSENGGETRNMTEPAIEITHAHDERFCGRCQSWLPDVIELHACKKAPRAIAYAWYEVDEPAFEKNAILHEGRKAKRGALIAKFLRERIEQ